jgi:hypothetical protein
MAQALRQREWLPEASRRGNEGVNISVAYFD